MRRNSYYGTQTTIPPFSPISPFNKNVVSDLIYRYETSSGPAQHHPHSHQHLQEILSSSPHLQRELELYYGQQYHRSDIRAELLRLKQLEQHNESLSSLTDSEFYSDDQIGGDGVGVGSGTDTDAAAADSTNRLTKKNIAVNLSRLSRFLDFLSRLPLPLSFTGMGICFLLAVFICPRACCENLLFPAFRLAFGTLYPAYASYKAVRTKNVKEYVKWMMYWIVFAFFTCIETVTDIFLSWFPFYYEFKVIIVLWLLSPATKGSSTLYRKFVHPMLTRREQEIDEYLNQAKERGYTAVLQLGSKSVNYATNVIMQTALKGGGNLVQTIRKSYSLSDLSEPDVHRTQDEIDEVVRPQRLLRPRSQTVRSSSGGRQTSMYFSEVDVEPKIPPTNYNYIRSSEDISSGYSSAEPISGGLSRTASMTSTTRPRFKAKRAEDENFHITDELDVQRNMGLFLNNSIPDSVNPLQSAPNPNSRRRTLDTIENLEDWKDEAFFNNEQYYQRHQDELENIQNDRKPTKLGELNTKNMTPEMLEKYAQFCKWLETNEGSGQKPEENLKTYDPSEDDKNEKVKIVLDNSVTRSQVAKMTQKQSSEEDYKDTISLSASDDDEFVDVDSSNREEPDLNVANENVDQSHQPTTTNVDINADKTSEKLDSFANVVVLESEDSQDSEAIANKDTNSLEANIMKPTESKAHDDTNPTLSKEILPKEASLVASDERVKTSSPKLEDMLENIQKQVQSTLSEFKMPLKEAKAALSEMPSDFNSDNLKNRVTHGKGRAPEPPEKLSSNLSLSEQTSSSNRSVNQSPINTPSHDLIPSLKSIPDAVKQIRHDDHAKSHSRSPSPKPEGKKPKKSLFKNYLPSFFRSESPKTTQTVSDEYHKETQI